MDDAPQPPVIDLAHLDDATFQSLYAQRIEPCFAENESARVADVVTFKQRLWIGLPIAMVLGLIVGVWASHLVAGIVTAGIAGILAYAYAYAPLAALSKKLKRQYCTAIAQAMGATFEIGGFEPPALQRLKDLRLLPSYARSSFEDLFTGAHKGAQYQLYEAHLEQRHTDSKGRTYYSTVFRGQLIRMHFTRNFLGVTIVRRDAGVFNAFGGGMVDGKKLERVRLEDPKFEQAFEVWGNDQVEARYLLHPVMMEHLLGLEAGLKGKKLRCAFENGDVLVAVEGGNLFEPGDMFTPLVDASRARRIVDEIAGVVRVMDQVLTAQSLRPSPSA